LVCGLSGSMRVANTFLDFGECNAVCRRTRSAPGRLGAGRGTIRPVCSAGPDVQSTWAPPTAGPSGVEALSASSWTPAASVVPVARAALSPSSVLGAPTSYSWQAVQLPEGLWRTSHTTTQHPQQSSSPSTTPMQRGDVGELPALCRAARDPEPSVSCSLPTGLMEWTQLTAEIPGWTPSLCEASPAGAVTPSGPVEYTSAVPTQAFNAPPRGAPCHGNACAEHHRGVSGASAGSSTPTTMVPWRLDWAQALAPEGCSSPGGRGAVPPASAGWQQRQPQSVGGRTAFAPAPDQPQESQHQSSRKRTARRQRAQNQGQQQNQQCFSENDAASAISATSSGNETRMGSGHTRIPQTTLIFRHLALSFSVVDLIDRLESRGYGQQCDYVYVPVGPVVQESGVREWQGCGFAFVNFLSSADAEACRVTLDLADVARDGKVVEASFSRVQGRTNNEEAFWKREAERGRTVQFVQEGVPWVRKEEGWAPLRGV